MVSQDGGVPFMRKSWDGQTSDTQILPERAHALRAAFRRAPTPRSLGADSKLDNEDNAPHLQQLGLIPRISNTLTRVSPVITQALQGDRGHPVPATTRYPRVAFGHYGMVQRGLVVSSEAALPRAEATGSKAQQRAYEPSCTQRFPLQATRCETPEAAHAALAAVAQSWR
jgi:hypothetical protein